MSACVVLIPVLDRPQNAGPVVRSLAASGADARPLFLLSPGDGDELAAVRETGAAWIVVPWECGPADYARKINLGAAVTDEPLIFQGGDDLAFVPGWFDAALTALGRIGEGVVGTNDDGNPMVKQGRHATHSLVTRAYFELGTVDEPHQILHEGYRHQYVDTELMGTAKARGRWVFATDSHVTHLHPLWGKGEMDATYRKALGDGLHDQRLFNRRSLLWRRP